MTTAPHVPYRLEFSVEVPGTREQVWQAVATARGMSAWFLPTALEEHEGGALHFAMGADMGSDGRVTAWQPPRRLVYEEDWAALMDKDPASLSPMTSEFVVEARSGGTCVVHVTTSGFGTGADWEQEWWDSMGPAWMPAFDALRLYLAHFPGETATRLEAQVVRTADGPGPVWDAMREALGLGEPGDTVTARGLTASVAERSDHRALLLLDAPVRGMADVGVFDAGDGSVVAAIRMSLFSPDAADYVEREQGAWQRWLDDVAGPGADAS